MRDFGQRPQTSDYQKRNIEVQERLQESQEEKCNQGGRKIKEGNEVEEERQTQKGPQKGAVHHETTMSNENVGTPKRQKKLTEYANIQEAMKSSMKSGGQIDRMKKIPGKLVGKDGGDYCQSKEPISSGDEEGKNKQSYIQN